MTWIIEQEQLKKEEIIRCFSDFDWRLRNLYYIVNEAWQTILFNPNFIQSRILAEKSGYRDAILKYRQWWVSTLFIIIMLDEVLFWWMNIYNIFITHRQDLLDTFFQKAKFTYESIPKKYKALLPKPTSYNANELAFDKTPSWKILNNRLKIALDVRWKTPTRLHVSEFWPMEKEKQIQLKLAMDNFRETRITIESTADWVWDVFYNMCMQAKNLIWTYKLLFYPWYIESRNTLKLREWEVLMLDEYEKQIQETYNLTLEQLNWRRQKIYDANALWEDWVAFFNQENPITIESAFITSWSSVFDTSAYYKIVQPIKIADEIKYFKPAGDKIVAWIDIAEWWIKWDFSTITWYNTKWEIVFTYKWKINEELLAKKVDSIFSQWYMFSLLPENNVWIAFINECKKYPWFIYMLLERRSDKVQWEETAVQRYWFKTTMKSKDLIIREYKSAIFKKEIEITEEIYAEIITYIYDKNNRPNAISPNHDDLLMSAMISRHWILTETNPAEKDDEKKPELWMSATKLRDKQLEKDLNKDLQEQENLLHGYCIENYC